MITCPKCNQILPDNSKFCSNCGAILDQKPAEAQFEKNLANMKQEPFVPQPMTFPTNFNQTFPAAQPAMSLAKKKKKSKAPFIILGVIGLIAAVAVIITVAVHSSSQSPALQFPYMNYAVYLKDEEIYLDDLKSDEDEPLQLTSNFFDGEYTYAQIAEKPYYYGYELGAESVTISENGKYVFFPDKGIGINEGEYAIYYNLYCIDISNPKEEPIKIDSDIKKYTVSSSGDTVIYLKGKESSLYRYKIADDSKEKIGSNVSKFYASDDMETIIYVNTENGIYAKAANRDREKLASNIDHIEKISEDFSDVYYIKEESLYKATIDGESEKIDSDVSDVCKIYDSGEIYYEKKRTKEFNLLDYVENDIWNRYGSQSNTRFDGNDYINSDNETTDYEKLWKEIAETTVTIEYYSLYFYDGKKEILISDDCDSFTSPSDNVPMIAYAVYEESTFKKVKLSELSDVYQAKIQVFQRNIDLAIANKGVSTVVDLENKMWSFISNASGTTVYYLDNIKNGYGDLHRITISDKSVVGKPELYDSDVSYFSYKFLDDTRLVYFKDFNQSTLSADLYIDGERVGHDISVQLIHECDDNKLLYITNWDDDKQCGTLKLYDGTETVRISDDVYKVEAYDNGRILYICDYSSKYCKGELREWYNGESKKLDDDVSVVFPISKENRR